MLWRREASTGRAENQSTIPRSSTSCLVTIETTQSLLLSKDRTKGKGKVHPKTGNDGPEVEKLYSSTLSLTLALIGGWVGGKRQAPVALPPRKNRYSLCRRLGGLQGDLDGCGKSRLPQRFDPRTVHPVASSYTA